MDPHGCPGFGRTHFEFTMFRRPVRTEYRSSTVLRSVLMQPRSPQRELIRKRKFRPRLLSEALLDPSRYPFGRAPDRPAPVACQRTASVNVSLLGQRRRPCALATASAFLPQADRLYVQSIISSMPLADLDDATASRSGPDSTKLSRTADANCRADPVSLSYPFEPIRDSLRAPSLA